MPIIMTMFRSTTFSLALLCVSVSVLHAKVQLPSIFSDHMELQKSAETPVWGTAAPGEAIAVALESIDPVKVVAGADGKWKADLNLEKAGLGPFKLTVTGANQIIVSDVVVGDVWLASGQSNMEFELPRAIGAEAELALPANPMLRQFLIKETASPVPKADCVGKWMIAGPDTYAQFTAVGYYFGKSLQQKLKTPIGLINASYGGSTVEAWISTAGFKGDSELNAGMDKLCGDTGSYPQRQKDYVKQYHAWAAKYGREDHPAADTQAFTAAKIPPEGWKPVSMPGTLATAGLPDAGAVWLRKTVTVPGGLAHHGLVMNLALPRDFDAVYYDGIKIASTTPDATTSRNFIASFSNARRCDVPDTAVKAGESVFAIRLFNPAGGIGIGPNYAKLAAGNLNLNGEWLAKAEYELPPLSPEAKSSYPQMPLMPPNVRDLGSYLFNAMINPIIPYGIKGEIWYQGESNISRGFQYRTAFSLLIQDWRSLWKRGDFPVYYCQLPNYSTKETTPGESDMAEMREAQSMALKLPNTGQAVLIDIGEEGDIHCRDKADVGDRLARLALAKTYGQAIDYSGPVYRSMSVEGKTARIRFDFANKLTARALPATYQPRSGDPATKPTVRNSSDSELEGFAICGGDHRFVWANAKIDGNTVVVSSLAVENPVAVRYAWADDPTCNLYNGAGLPASPFRTDDFPAHTLLAHYGL